MLLLNDDISKYSKEVAKGSMWSLLGNAAFKLSSFFYVILIARMASQEDIGLFYAGLAIVGLVELFSHVGYPTVMQRYVPYYIGKEQYGKVRHLLKFGYILLAATGLIAIAALWFGADAIAEFYEQPLLAGAIRMFSAYILLNSVLRLHLLYLQGRTDIRSMQFVGNSQNFLKLVITFVLFYLYGASLEVLVAGLLSSILVAVVISTPIIYRKVIDLPKSAETIPRKEIVKEIAPFGLVMTFITTLWVIAGSFDRLFLLYLADDPVVTVAIYSIAVTFAGVLMQLPVSVGTIFLPIMSRLAGQKNYKEMRETTETASRWTLFITIPAAIVMILFAADILAMFYGEPYRPGGMVMAILTLAFLIRSFSFMITLLLMAIRKVYIELKVSLIVNGLNVAMNILLIPIYGMEGAAAATLLGFVVMFFLIYYYAKKLFRFTFSMQIYKTMLAGLTAFLVLMLIVPVITSIPLPVIGGEDMQFISSKVVFLAYLSLLGVLALAVFLLFLLLFRCINRDDIILMKKALKRFYVPSFLISLAEKILSYGLERKK